MAGSATHRRRVRGDALGDVDEGSERWITAVHEAGHLTLADALCTPVDRCRIDPDGRTGTTRHTATGWAHAAIAVAGARATRLICGNTGGSHTDYRDAEAALARAGHPRTLPALEAEIDDLLAALRRDLLRTARQLYRTGSR
jgi:hypothetical protein